MITKVGNYFFKDGFQRIIPSREQVKEALDIPKKVHLTWDTTDRNYQITVAIGSDPVTYTIPTFRKATRYKAQLIEQITDHYFKKATEAPSLKELLA